MIWFKENEKIIGCVPILKKEYISEEIREMSNMDCITNGWTELSQLVMQIQGISYSYKDTFSKRSCYKIEASRTLADIEFKMRWLECFSRPSNPMMKKYIRYIFEVFKNLTLYKVKSYSEEELKEKMEKMEEEFKFIITEKSFDILKTDLEEIRQRAEDNTIHLHRINNIFYENGLILTGDLFKEADETILRKVYKTRKIAYEALGKVY